MRLDRKGDIGFMEAMAGAMTVCIVMLGFTAFLAADMSQSDGEQIEFDWNCLNTVTVSDNAYCFETDKVISFMEKTDYTYISVEIRSAGTSGITPASFSYGDLSDERYTERKLFTVGSDDGQYLPTIAEVMICE